jgi:serine/tyrosine/threonine adenylyltransferase
MSGGVALHFDNAFTRDLPGDTETSVRPRQVVGALWSPVLPTPVSAPRLVAWSPSCAALVGLDAQAVADERFVAAMAGNALLDGMRPFAANYGGHQFGNWAGQLGDGRAISLGEVLNDRGERWELQLKGAGPTPYSRRADGRAVLRSSIREFLCSEAMHHLGVPTTRALTLVTTGDAVLRDMFYDGRPREEPGAIVCRVAPSFIRFGNFELLAARDDIALLARLVDFTIARDFPHLDGEPRERRTAWFREVAVRTARMVAEWMRVGFVHGVMNTDNMSILGQTIDYGPYGWLEEFDPTWTPNTTDAVGRRYRYGQQPAVAQWNLVQLAEALVPLFGSAEPLEAGLDAFLSEVQGAIDAMNAAKFGLSTLDAPARALVRDGYGLFQSAHLDFTNGFRTLTVHDPANVTANVAVDALGRHSYDDTAFNTARGSWQAWWDRYRDATMSGGLSPEARRVVMERANPVYVLRNYLAQEAIEAAEQGDLNPLRALESLITHPYEERPGLERYTRNRPEWAREKAGSSMLSCSS